jgi:putative glutathione S-transferase
MKALINGVWHSDAADTPAFRIARAEDRKRTFRHHITAQGSGDFIAEPDRYHLYVSYACPWAHRTILYRQLKGLNDVIGMSVLHPHWGGDNGWTFEDGPYSTRDHVSGFDFLYQVYQAANPDFSGKITVPVLWDKKTKTIVNAESGDIIRMLDQAFDQWGDASVRFYPEHLRNDIDAINAVVLGRVSMGVYKAGFASTQGAYERAIDELFQTLDELNQTLSKQRFLIGDQITEADWHLFATLVRFDAVYHGKLKCSLKRLIDYPHLTRYTNHLFNLPGVAETVKLDHIKMHYYDDLGIGNPRIIPVDPAFDFRRAA